jgi:hypothetical protein
MGLVRFGLIFSVQFFDFRFMKPNQSYFLNILVGLIIFFQFNWFFSSPCMKV